MRESKLQFMVIMLAIMSLGVISAGAAKPTVEVKQTTDLAKLGAIASEKNVPILLVFSAEHCTYCELLEDEILKPMLLSGEYRQRALIYKVMVDDSTELRDFNGNFISADTLMHRYNVFVTPTTLFLDNNGKELSERLLGINTVEMFGGLVDQAIDTSLEQLRNGSKQLASSRP